MKEPTPHMITACVLVNSKSTSWIRAYDRSLRHKLLWCRLLLKSLFLLSIVLWAGQASMPGHHMCEACLEMTCVASHDRLIVATIVDLTRATSRIEAHSKVRHITKHRHDRQSVVSANELLDVSRLQSVSLVPLKGCSGSHFLDTIKR